MERQLSGGSDGGSKMATPIYGCSPTDKPRKIGSYLLWTTFAMASITSGMFMTSFPPNVLATEIARKITREMSTGPRGRSVPCRSVCCFLP